MSNFRTRQAPSPTGYLHFGTARQMLFTKLMSKINNGKWYLRLEDTDRGRLQAGSVGSLLNSLEMLGLSPDEGVNNEKGEKDEFYGVYQYGDFGPYIQSERLAIYHEHAQKMIDQKLAYWCFLNEEEREELQTIKKVTKAPINYFKVCEEKYGEEIWISVENGLKDERKPTLRYRIQQPKIITFEDVLLGKSEFDLLLEEDFVILKSDGFPTYHLAHVIDDYLMQTTLVIRAQEWFPSTAKHIAMFQDYWGVVPEYLHLPVILGETGNKKMSKRDGNVNIEDYLNAGYLPEAIVNYLAFLGWNPGDEKELYLTQDDFNILNLDQRLNKLINNLALDFSVDKLNKSPSRFSLEKLNWFNREYIKMMKVGEFTERAFSLKTSEPANKIYIFDPIKSNLFVKNQFNNQGETILSLPVVTDGGEVSEVSQVVEKITKLEEFACATFSEGFVVKTSDSLVANYFYEDTLNPGQYVRYEWVDANAYFSKNNREFMHFYLFLKDVGESLAGFEKLYLLNKRGFMFDKERISVLNQVGVESKVINDWSKPESRDLVWKKSDTAEAHTYLRKVYENVIAPFYEAKEAEDILRLQNSMLQSIENDASYQDIKDKFLNISLIWEGVIKDWINVSGLNAGSVLWPLRVALSGEKKSPSPFEILAVLDESEVKFRIETSLSS